MQEQQQHRQYSSPFQIFLPCRPMPCYGMPCKWRLRNMSLTRASPLQLVILPMKSSRSFYRFVQAIYLFIYKTSGFVCVELNFLFVSLGFLRCSGHVGKWTLNVVCVGVDPCVLWFVSLQYLFLFSPRLGWLSTSNVPRLKSLPSFWTPSPPRAGLYSKMYVQLFLSCLLSYFFFFFLILSFIWSIYLCLFLFLLFFSSLSLFILASFHSYFHSFCLSLFSLSFFFSSLIVCFFHFFQLDVIVTVAVFDLLLRFVSVILQFRNARFISWLYSCVAHLT